MFLVEIALLSCRATPVPPFQVAGMGTVFSLLVGITAEQQATMGTGQSNLGFSIHPVPVSFWYRGFVLPEHHNAGKKASSLCFLRSPFLRKRWEFLLLICGTRILPCSPVHRFRGKSRGRKTPCAVTSAHWLSVLSSQHSPPKGKKRGQFLKPTPSLIYCRHGYFAVILRAFSAPGRA